MAEIIVFENHTERAQMSAGPCHDWEHQKQIFGTETKKLLLNCSKLFRVATKLEEGDSEMLLKKIFGIAKSHGVRITWYGNSKSACEPDRFLVSGYGIDRLAFIQC